jgi:hypothetical protein
LKVLRYTVAVSSAGILYFAHELHLRNRLLRSIFGPEKEKLAREWGELYYKPVPLEHCSQEQEKQISEEHIRT